MNSMEFKRAFFCLFLAFIFISLFSSSTSWMYGNVEYLDSDVFSVVGKYWAQGYLPYIDLWDQKGPIIHFVNAIGYTIANARIGVFGVQVACLAVTFYFTVKLLQEEFGIKVSLLLTVIAALGLLNDYGVAGNNVEEYLLPLLTMTFYFMYKWAHEPQKIAGSHSPYFAAVYGIAFGISIYTRMTNAVGLCGGVLIIALFMFHQRQWGNLFRNAIAFLIGTLIVLLPFIIYFYYHNGLYELWYGTISYNVEYAQNAPQLDPFSLNQTLYLYKSALNGLLLLIVSLYLLCFVKERKVGLLWLSVSLFSLLWLMTGNGFHHYFIITYPYFCICINELYALNRKHKMKRSVSFRSICAISLVLFLASTYEMYGAYRKLTSNNDNLSFYDEVKSDIPTQDFNSFVAYNVSPYIYLYLDVKPCCRFFAYQDPQISFGHTLKEKVMREFEQKKAKWILMANDSKNLANLLKQEYKLEKCYENGMKLYRHR